jgi:hypothetical protein
MAKKLSSYQKLKKKNEELTRDIYLLVREPKTALGIQVWSLWNTLFGMQDAVMFGSAGASAKGRGILSYITRRKQFKF